MTQPPREVAALLKRLTELAPREQLQAYQLIHDYLTASGHELPRERELDERASALEAMAAVADYYGITDRLELEVKRFDSAPEDVRAGWKSGKIIRLFGTWRFAREQLAGRKPRETARQVSIRRAAATTKLKSDDYLTTLREWLATDPPHVTWADYDEWARERNERLPEGVLRAARFRTIRAEWNLEWATALRVARGELELEDARKKKIQRRLAKVRGEHDLIAKIDIMQMSGKGGSTVNYWMHSSALGVFPTPVLVIGERKIYLREDVKAFLRGKKFKQREIDELRPLYLTTREAAEIAGYTKSSWEQVARKGKSGEPLPIAHVGGVLLWLRSEVEAFARERAARERPKPWSKAKAKATLPDKNAGNPEN